ncbi:hypothetical protein [Clostridium sp.]|uniref:hypothetical protein n=1 Tax=Clostridium sp. TaxID=1506 RepID=UPI003F7FCC53
MKKKLLSLVLAGAMVASTSVSAFAQGPTVQTPSADKEISQTPSEATAPREYSVTNTDTNAEINIEGRIANNTNVLPPSTISVSVPTAASFTVDKKGNLIGSTITITSQGTEEVEVLAYKFNDSTDDAGIKVISSSDFETENKKPEADRKKVTLSLRGEKAVSLITDTATNTNGKNGIYKYNTTVEATQDDDKKVGTVTSSKPLKLNLEGNGITNGTALGNAISDNFTLTLKLKKVNH